ncbi:Fic family protein [Pelomyxa schiedti]|nr:Fic family protein [Pelomyxa schiedti]
MDASTKDAATPAATSAAAAVSSRGDEDEEGEATTIERGPHAWGLSWGQIAAGLGGRPWDPAPALAIATGLVTPMMTTTAAATDGVPRRRLVESTDNWAGWKLQKRVHMELIREYGDWACGWCWTLGEGGEAGVIKTWCCNVHSFKDNAEENVVAALTEWRSWCLELSEIFAKLRKQLACYDPAQATARAASHLLPLVVKWTGSQDAWYHTFAVILSWYLSSFLPEKDVQDLILTTMGGRFESWSSPDSVTAQAVCEDVGRAVGAKLSQAQREAQSKAKAAQIDSLSDWLRIRNSFSWLIPEKSTLPTAGRDGHVEYITTHDAKRDPARATNMMTALSQAREAAARGVPLTFELISTWQQTVLGTATVPKFRTTDAFAKEGSERYPYTATTQAQFTSALSQSEGTSNSAESTTASSASAPSPSARQLGTIAGAARAYLDVCFFHPFEDGNARCARLVLDFILHKGGLRVTNMEPLVMPWYASDTKAPPSFLQALLASVCSQ